MTPFEQEQLHQALLDLEHLRQEEALSRRNAESLLSGLELLSTAQSEADSVQTILSVLSSVIEVDAALVLSVGRGQKLVSLAETDPQLSIEDGTVAGPIARAVKGKPVVLADATQIGWSDDLGNGRMGRFGSALLIPVQPVDRPCIIVCLRKEKASFSRADLDRLHYLIPLAAQAIRHSFRLADLHQAVIDLEQARRLAEERARTDPLTGLANRMRVEEFMTSEMGDRREWCFVLVDMNGFKPINDNFGHHAGDHVLVETGRRLSKLFTRRALVARLGGDEFGLLVPSADGREAAMDIGTMVCSAFVAPIEFGEHKFRVGASIGIALLSEFGSDFEEIMTAADFAMFSVKALGETNFAVYDRRENKEKARRVKRGDIVDAIEDGAIVPFFQPQIDLVTGELTGFEILARWMHPLNGLIAPIEFLPVVAKSGLTEKFTLSLMRQVLVHCDEWQASGLPYPRLCFNLTEATLSAEQGVDHLIGLLEDFPGAPGSITLEVTENVAFGRGAEQMKRSVRRLASAGYEISLDDFGTGYASLSILDEFDFCELKIDRSFIAEIDKSRSSEVVIEAVIALAHGHDARVVAEGVELMRQVNFLRQRSCDLGQGYLFGKPTDARRTEALLRSNDPLLPRTSLAG